MVNRFKIYFAALLLIFSSFLAEAQNFPEPQSPARLVNDFAAILTPIEEQQLEQHLVGFCDTTSNEIAVVTINTLDGMDIAQYATELAEKWGIGSAKNDNGVLLLVKPKSANEKGEVFIAVGYGLEGAIPDVVASRIIREITIPRFSKGDMFGGIAASVEQLMMLSSDEYRAERKARESEDMPIMFLTIAIIIIFSIISTLNRKSSRNSNGQGGAAVPPIFMFGPTWGSSSRGSSSGFGGDSFGGGFGGFGGGSFGGGGAGGSW